MLNRDKKVPNLVCDLKVVVDNVESGISFNPYCLTPSPVLNWGLTLFSLGNNNKNNKKKKKNNPHIWGYPRALKFCMRPSITKRI